MLDKLKAFMNHERYQVITISIVCLLLVWMFSCESKVQSLENPGQKITRAQLQTELDYILAQAKIRFTDLDRQDKFKQYITEKALLYAQGGTINPFGLLLTIGGILGTGATVDRVRAKKKVTKVKHEVIDHGVNT